MKLVLVLLICVTSAFAARVARWVNSFDKPFTVQCNPYQSIGSISSIHNNNFEDRVWDFTCKNTFSKPASCFWTSYVNQFDKPFTFRCPSGSVLNGMNSYHDNSKEDRRWRFKCCRGNVRVGRSCGWTRDYQNEFDQELRWSTPAGHYLAGAASYHDNRREDRRWKYFTCQMG